MGLDTLPTPRPVEDRVGQPPVSGFAPSAPATNFGDDWLASVGAFLDSANARAAKNSTGPLDTPPPSGGGGGGGSSAGDNARLSPQATPFPVGSAGNAANALPPFLGANTSTSAAPSASSAPLVSNTTATSAAVTVDTPKGRDQTSVLPSFAVSKVGFEVNVGQTDKSVLYLSHGPGFGLWLTRDQMVFGLPRVVQQDGKPLRDGPPVGQDVFRATMVGANPDAEVVGLDGTNALVTRHVYAGGVDQSVAFITGGVVSWYLTDRQGSVMGIMTATQTLSGLRKYDAFGTATLVSGSSGVFDRYGFTDREVDPTTGARYHRERWVDATNLRWMSRDPIEFEVGYGNLYDLVGNDGTNTSDPSGLNPIGAFFRGVGDSIVDKGQMFRDGWNLQINIASNVVLAPARAFGADIPEWEKTAHSKMGKAISAANDEGAKGYGKLVVGVVVEEATSLPRQLLLPLKVAETVNDYGEETKHLIKTGDTDPWLCSSTWPLIPRQIAGKSP